MQGVRRDHLQKLTLRRTFDANTLQEVGRFDWPDGGLSAPAIGPQGNVSAIAGNQPYVFPGPGQAGAGATGPGSNPALPVTQLPAQPVSTQPTQPAEPAQPGKASGKAYKPPLTASGNWLFACQNPDGDDCGKGDARDIAADRSFETPDRVRDIANLVLSRAAIMESEIDRFMAVARGQRHSFSQPPLQDWPARIGRAFV